MLTCCTNCHAQFEINDRLVRENDALVRCGECQTQFDARQNLVDRYSGMPYVFAEDELALADADGSDGNWSESDLDYSPDSSDARLAPARPNAAQALEFDYTSALTGVEPAYHENTGFVRSNLAIGTDHPYTRERAAQSPVAADGYDLELPDVINDSNQRQDWREHEGTTVHSPPGELATPHENPPIGAKRFSLTGPVLVLLIAGLVSMLYGWREQIAQLPLPQPISQAFCAVTGCQPTLERDVSQLQLLQKKIYTHPSVVGALIVSLDLVNNAEIAQIYPQLSIKMANESGVTVAHRSFSPDEYLAEQFVAQKLIPGKPVRIQLELMDPGVDARTFELGFE